MIIAKIMLLGEMAVGKTSIANRLVFDRFDHSYKSTIGTDVYRYDVEPGPDGQPFQFLVWDTDGNYEEAMFRSSYIRGAHAAIIVGDLSRPQTLETQLRLARMFCDEMPGRYFAGVLNKKDLVDGPTKDCPELPEALRKPFFPVIEASAKTGYNVQKTFVEAARTIARRGL